MEDNRHPEEYFKVQHRNFYAMVFMALFHGFGLSMFDIVYQPFLYEFVGDSIFLTGMLITLGSLIFILPLPWVGRLSDRFGRKLVWYIGEPFIILGLFSFIFANNISFLILGVISYSFGNLILNIIFLVFVSENSPESKKGFNFGLIFFALFGGNIAGSSFVLIDLGLNVRIYFALFIVVILINIIILVFIIKEPKVVKEKIEFAISRKLKPRKGIWRKMWQIQKNRNLILFFTLHSFIWSISTSIYNTGMIEQYLITQQNIALLSLSTNISLMIFQIPAGYLLDKIGRKKTLILSEVFGLIFFSVVLLAFILWSNTFQFVLLPLLIVGQIIRSLSNATFTPSQLTITTNLDEDRRAESFGIVDFFTGIGSMPTGIIAGLLIANLHYITPFIFTLMGIIFMIWFLIKYFQEDPEIKEESMVAEK